MLLSACGSEARRLKPAAGRCEAGTKATGWVRRGSPKAPLAGNRCGFVRQEGLQGAGLERDLGLC